MVCGTAAGGFMCASVRLIAKLFINLPDELEEASRLLPSKIKKKAPLPERELVRAITKDDKAP
jgi:hypothetical protein